MTPWWSAYLNAYNANIDKKKQSKICKTYLPFCSRKKEINHMQLTQFRHTANPPPYDWIDFWYLYFQFKRFLFRFSWINFHGFITCVRIIFFKVVFWKIFVIVLMWFHFIVMKSTVSGLSVQQVCLVSCVCLLVLCAGVCPLPTIGPKCS